MGLIADKFRKHEEKKPTEVTPPQTPIASSPIMDGLFKVEPVDVIKIKGINKSFDNGVVLFKDFSLNIKDFSDTSQRISLIGQSGCGKSMLLKMISQLVVPDSGTIEVYDTPVEKYPRIPMVFQQYSSFPNRTVLENVTLPLKLKGVPKKERIEKAKYMLKVVGLEGQEDKWAQYPILSGGQLQRVAIARNLVSNDNKVLLLDEATGALDIKSKRDIEDAILGVCYSSRLDPTIINVTHDISEAVYISNRVYVLQANPCRIHKVIDIDFGVDKRDQSIRNTNKFGQYVKEIEESLNEVIK